MKTLITRMTLIALAWSAVSHGQNFAQLNDEERQWIEEEGTGTAPADLDGFKESDLSTSQKTQVLAAYSHLDPQHLVPVNLLEKAVTYFDANKSKFANQKVITVIDFSKNSKSERFWVIDLTSGAVWAMRSAHGKGSDTNDDGQAESFGNAMGSGKSSLGYYRTAETYQGKNGYSLRLDGLSTTNSNVRSRAVVVHGANYVNEIEKIQGRSLGCPAVTHANRDKLIDQIKEGSLIYAGLSGVP